MVPAEAKWMDKPFSSRNFIEVAEVKLAMSELTMRVGAGTRHLPMRSEQLPGYLRWLANSRV